MKSSINLVYKIDTIEGISIEVLCKSLQAINDEFTRFTGKKKTLVIKEVRKGSGIFEFMEQVVVPVFVTMEVFNTTVQFAEYLSSVKDVLLGKSDKLPDDIVLTKQSIANVDSIMSPTIIGNNNTANFYVGETP